MSFKARFAYSEKFNREHGELLVRACDGSLKKILQPLFIILIEPSALREITIQVLLANLILMLMKQKFLRCAFEELKLFIKFPQYQQETCTDASTWRCVGFFISLYSCFLLLMDMSLWPHITTSHLPTPTHSINVRNKVHWVVHFLLCLPLVSQYLLPPPSLATEWFPFLPWNTQHGMKIWNFSYVYSVW